MTIDDRINAALDTADKGKTAQVDHLFVYVTNRGYRVCNNHYKSRRGAFRYMKEQMVARGGAQ